jgi:hypothetical protein
MAVHLCATNGGQIILMNYSTFTHLCFDVFCIYKKKNYEHIVLAQRPKQQAIRIDQSTSYTQNASLQRPSDHSYGLQVFVAGQDPLLCFFSDFIDQRVYRCLICI